MYFTIKQHKNKYHCKMTEGFVLRWRLAWKEQKFKQLTLIGIVFFIITLVSLPFFFNYIQQREGSQINDFLLNQIRPRNVSNLVFSIIWSMAVLTLIRCIQQPSIFLMFLWGFILLSFSRMISIIAVPLNPPDNLLELIDPISNTFYGSKFVTKDLFYSGHTATQFLMFLCLKNKWDKLATLISTFLIGALVLVQHIHYTIDVLAAPILTYLVFILVKKIITPALESLSYLKV
jgi:hypothetical protein